MQPLDAARTDGTGQEAQGAELRSEQRPVQARVDEAHGSPANGGPGTGPSAPRRKRSYGISFWLAIAWLGLVMFAALFSTLLPLPDPNAVDVSHRLARPFTEGHFLGSDGLGRDILSRLFDGARVSLTISVSAVLVGATMGGTIGMIAGFFRGRPEMLIVSAVDVILAFPGLVLLLALVATFGQSLKAITLAVALLSIPVYTRVARATTLSVAQREYVLAARAMGATHRRIIFREIMPNVFLPVAAFGLIALGVVVVLEGTLSFLGLSVQPPDATWGGMISEGKRHLSREIHVALIPSLVLFFTVLSLNFVGDTLRSHFDVREANV